MILAATNDPQEAIRKYKLFLQAVDNPSALRMYLRGTWSIIGTNNTICSWRSRSPGLEAVDVNNSRKVLSVVDDDLVVKVRPVKKPLATDQKTIVIVYINDEE